MSNSLIAKLLTINVIIVVIVVAGCYLASYRATTMIFQYYRVSLSFIGKFSALWHACSLLQVTIIMSTLYNYYTIQIYGSEGLSCL